MSSLHFVTQFRLATPDSYLIFFCTLAFISLFHGHQKKHTLFLMLGYAAMAPGFVSIPLLDARNPVDKRLPTIGNSPVLAKKRFISSFAFYLNPPITKVHNAMGLMQNIKAQKVYVIPTARYPTELDTMQGFQEELPRLKDLLVQDLLENPITQVFSYRP